MSAKPLRTARGLTLVELMISVTIMLIAVIAASALIVAGSNMTARAEQRTTAENSAREAMEIIGRSLASAGMGAKGGVYVRWNGSTQLINPVFGIDGSATGLGVDELWLVVADRSTLREPGTFGSCGSATLGSAAVNYTTGFANGVGLQVSCIDGFSSSPPVANDTLLVTNWNTAALLYPTALNPGASSTAPATIAFADSATDLSPAPNQGGFKAGDQILHVRVLHYYVAINSATQRPALWAARGIISSSGTVPFTDYAPVVVQDNIEDLQVTFVVAANEFGPVDEKNPLPSNGFAAARQAGSLLRAVNVSVVGITPVRQRTNTSAIISSNQPVFPLENHLDTSVLGANADGYGRVVYRRRFELPNLSPSLL